MHKNNNEEAELLKYAYIFSKWYFLDIWLTKSESVINLLWSLHE